MAYLDNFFKQFSGLSTGKKLVFLHGLMGSAQNWMRISPHFESRFNILCYDQRGHGKSFKPKTGYSPEDYADDLYLILEELNWNKIILVGHSMGGRNAINFATRFPDKISGLVIEDIGPDKNLESIKDITFLLENIPTPFPTKLKAKEFFMNEFYKLAATWPQKGALSQFFYSNIEETSTGEYDWRFSKSAILQSLNEVSGKERWDDFYKIRVPTLIIRGENSRDLSRKDYEKMLSATPSISGVEISNSGHWVHFDQPQEFIKSLESFLNTLKY